MNRGARVVIILLVGCALYALEACAPPLPRPSPEGPAVDAPQACKDMRARGGQC